MTSSNRSRWSRFVRITKPFFTAASNRWSLGLFFTLIALVFVVKGLDIGNSFVYGHLITSATERKAGLVLHLALLYASVFAVSAVVATMLRYTEESLGLRWRVWLTRHLTDRYLTGRAYHRIKETGKLDNPDQRISEDVKTFTTNTLSIVLIVVNATVALAGFAGVLWSITPWLLVGAVGYAAFGTFMTVVLGKRLVGLDVRQFKKEADFRYELIRLREHADAIALLGGEQRENSRVRRRLARVWENFRLIIGVNRNLNFFTSWYGYMTRLIPVLITLPLYIRGEIEFGQVAQAEVGFNFVLDAFSLIVKEFQRITTFAAVVERLGAFYEATEEVPAGTKSLLEIVEDETRVAYQGLTLTTPDDGRLLIANLSLELPRGRRLLIDGPDGSGRTSLMRVTAGLWRDGQGRIVRPPLERIAFLPQQPYLPLGTLRDQLLYSTPEDKAFTDEQLLSVLRDVRLEAILDRVGGLDVEQRDWSSILSLGEQQSLAFARLLLNEPDFAFLDEAASALPTDRIRELYDLLSRTPTTYLTVGSVTDLFEYHDTLLSLAGDGTWRISTLVDEPCPAEESAPPGYVHSLSSV